MKRPLFPPEFIETSIEHYTFQIGKKAPSIYLTVIGVLCLILVALPFVRININVRASGFVGTEEKNYEIITPTAGILTSYDLKENKQLQKGQTILTFDSSSTQKEIEQLKNRIEQSTQFIRDLKRLTIDRVSGQSELHTTRYRLNYANYESQLNKLLLEETALLKVYARQSKLLDQEVISRAEFEVDQSKLELIGAAIDQFKKQSLTNWKEDLLTIEKSYEALSIKLKEHTDQQLRFKLKAPANGEAQNIRSLEIGQYVSSGLKIGEISPDTPLLAICWVDPTDIGLLRNGMGASFRITAFNSNEWGFLNGTISEVSSDAYIVNELPYFKVKCRLDSHFLTLNNGFKGNLKKGMTLQGNFKVTNRSLFQLLYDKTDDWLNPNVITNLGK